jgi:PKD repeat protein
MFTKIWRVKDMRQIKKKLSILLIVCFLLSVTAAAVTAEKTGNDKYNGSRSPVKVVANFSVSPISGEAPLKVNFTDKSTGTPISWKWSFGDGKSSYQRNPEHIYNKAGNYTVTLTVKNNKSSDTEVKKRYITVTKQPIINVVANFSVSSTSGEAPLKVNFTDKSTGTPNSWKWSFGDGKSSYQRNPEHIYNKAGNYTVTLTVKKNKSIDTEAKKKYITVTKQKPVVFPIADFSVASNSVKESKPIKFIDKSTGLPTSWKWNFGDGKSSYQQNPKHKYDKEGTYTVSLKVTNKNGSNTKTTTIKVIKK